MTDNKHLEKIYKELFSIPKSRVYAILDGASIKDLLFSLDEHEPDCFCLYSGTLPHDVEACAPYLIQLEKDSQFTQWILENGWGNHWGIFAVAPDKIKAMRKHFRSFIKVKDPEGTTLFFRYYDPRVLKIYLPTCNKNELATIFGPVICYIQEGDRPDTLLKFRLQDSNDLMTEKIELKGMKNL